MIAPFTPLPIRGVIWYQGESNTDDDRAPIYANLFQTMIRDWRAHWAQGDCPFLFVQIANFNTTGDGWPIVRDAQRKTLALANTGMAVTIDIGDSHNIHPRDKADVGHRLALWARVLSYGEHIEDSGPLFRQAVPERNSMRVWFDHATGGVIAKGGELHGFEVAGVDGKFVPATARVDGSTVLVSSTAVASPVYVRYGWAADPKCNLYNGDDLPASPFTSQQ
jgi:sialate O-acetylesterase